MSTSIPEATLTLLLLCATGCLESLPQITTTTDSVRAKVTGIDGSPAAHTLVRLEVLDDRGEPTWTGHSAISDVQGEVELVVDGALGSHFVLVAYLPAVMLRAPAFTDGARCEVHPATEALVQIIVEITASDGGPSFAHLDTETLRSLHDMVMAALPEGLDLSQGDTVAAWARTIVGDALAAAFAGEIAAWPTAAVLGTNAQTVGPEFATLPAPQPGAPCNRRNYPVEGRSFVFDLLPDGSICDGNDGNQFDAFDIAFSLRVDGDAFVGGDQRFPDQLQAMLEDEREVLLGPAELQSGMEVTRKVWVTPEDDIARYLEVITNPTASAHTVALEIVGDLGSDANTVLFVSQSNDARVELGDSFAATFDIFPFDPTVGYLWDADGFDSADRLYFPPDSLGGFQYAWEDVSVAPGETKVFAHFVLLSSVREQSSMRQRLEAMLAAPPLDGLSSDEVSALQNVHLRSLANVQGRAGSTAPGLLTTVRNLRSGTESATVAHLDGSFELFLIDTFAGDELLVRSLSGGERRVWAEMP